MSKKVFSLTVIAVFMACGILLGHPGRLDKDGGHWDHSKKEYHYHRDGKIVVDKSKKYKESGAAEKKAPATKTVKRSEAKKKEPADRKKTAPRKTMKKSDKGKTEKSGKKAPAKKAPAKKYPVSVIPKREHGCRVEIIMTKGFYMNRKN